MVDCGYGAVIAFGETVVALESDEAHVGEIAAHPFHRIIVGAVVGHDEFHFRARSVGHCRRNKTFEQAAAVPVEDYYC